MNEKISIEDVNEVIAEALRGGAILLTSIFTKDYASRRKADGTLVTDADIASQEFIIEVLSREFPDICVDSEEERLSELELRNSPTHWIVDPLDGTQNFATLNPYFGIAIGLVSDDVVVAGGVIQPFTDLLFTFGGAQGPLINGKTFVRSENAVARMREAVIAFIPTAVSQRTEFAQRTHATIYKSSRRLIDNWAPALDWCGLASGRINAIVSFGKADGYQDFDSRIGKALFEAVWQHDAHIEQHVITVDNVPNVFEIASMNSDLVHEIRVRLLNEM